MTPEENFRFIDRFLGAVGPIIRFNSGFFDKYIGDWEGYGSGERKRIAKFLL